MAEAAPAAPYDERLKRALDALVYTPPSVYTSASDAAAANDAADEVLRVDDADTTQADDGACRPDERGDYLRRLRSFRPSLWGARPGCVGPVAAARRGWCALDGEPDLLACDSCGARLAFSIPPDWSVAQTQQAAAQVAPKLDSAHKPACPWRGVVVPASVVAFPRLPRAALAAGFEARAAALAALPRLPALAPAAPGASASATASSAAALALPGAPPRALQALDALVAARRESDATKRAAAAAAAAAEPQEVAAAAAAAARDVAVLALAGWRLRPAAPPQAAALRCDACGAVAGLWNVAPGRPPPGAPVYASAASAVRLAALSSPAPPARASLTALFFSSSPPSQAVLPAQQQRQGGTPALGMRTIAGGIAPAVAAAALPVFGKRSAGAAFGGGGGGGAALGSPATKVAKMCEPPASPAPSAGGMAAALAPLAPPPSPLPPFAPLGGHRPFCPWVAAWPAASEARPGAPEPPPPLPGAAPGWLLTLDALAPPEPPQRGAPGAGGTHLQPVELTPASARVLVADLLAGRAIRPEQSGSTP